MTEQRKSSSTTYTVFASMHQSMFNVLPDTTNAVEAHNRISKPAKGPEPLQVALLSLYKKDMVVALCGLALRAQIPTTYLDQTPSRRGKRAAAKMRRRFGSTFAENAEGPPDEHSDFKRASLKRKRNKNTKQVWR